jgi:hypothetical protein
MIRSMKKMKNQNFMFILILIIFSCKKENISKIEEDSKLKEKFITEFTNYQTEIEFNFATWNGVCGSYHSCQKHRLRLIPGIESGDKYFYSIEKSALFLGQIPCYDTLLYTQWQQIQGYYRYSFEEKRGLYQDINDLNPKVLMDFNCQVGDTIIMDESSFTSIIVTSISSVTIQNIDFPKIIGRVVSFSKTGLPNPEFKPEDASHIKLLELTPFSCNPFWYGGILNDIIDDGWNPGYNWCVALNSYNLIEVITMSCTNSLTNSEYYKHGFYIL